MINEHSCNKFVLLLYNLSGKIIHEKFSDFMQIDVVMYVEVQSSSPSLSYIPLSLTSLSANLPLILYLPLPFCIFPFPYLLYLTTFHRFSTCTFHFPYTPFLNFFICKPYIDSLPSHENQNQLKKAVV